MPNQRMTFDFMSARHSDDNGFLHVDRCNLTKSDVNEYWGYEIPDFERLGLNKDEIYGVLRPPEELEKAAPTLNGLPILDEHIMDHDASQPFKDKRIGAVGTSGEWSDPYIVNDIAFWDEQSIQEVESGRRRELSCGYTYEPVLEEGEFNGKKYRIRMADIKFNHVALVKEGRVPGAKVADGQTIPAKGECMSKLDKRIAPNHDKAKPPKDKVNTGDEELAAGSDNAAAENRVIAGIQALAKEFEANHEEAGINPAITDEEKESLGKVRDFLDSFNGGGKDEPAGTSADPMDAEPPPAGDSEAEDTQFEDDPMKALTSKTLDGKRPAKAFDAEAIKADIRREFRQKEQAILDVETLIGSTAKAMAMDSAEDVYRHALRTHGIEPGEGINMAGLKVAVAVLKKNLAAPAYRAMDAKPSSDESKVMDFIDKSPFGAQLR